MITELPIDCLSEYDSAAQWCARRGLTGAVGDPLPNLMDSDGALKWINAHPEAFQQRVKDFAYMMAMDKLNLPEL